MVQEATVAQPTTETTSIRVALRVLDERPDECANVTLTTGQKRGLLAVALLLAAAAALNARMALLAVNAAAMVFYIAYSAWRLWLVGRSLQQQRELPHSPQELALIPNERLPSYTVQVPLYREGAVLPSLVAHLSQLDYPAERLTVQLLLEEDDAETIEACSRTPMPPQFQPVMVPNSQPKTKPKACNWGLHLADSDLLVIYDAEDRPEPDQLRVAAAAFAKLPDEVAVLQAKLNYYNQRHNLLTRWFTAEYSTWFDLFLPGLTDAGYPLPLGGTSNHFKMDPLKRLGGWDPFNVTEDCDLGIRLHKHGYRAAVIDSTTWEEANGRLESWVRQRSRWVKGYLQTYLVHMRRPLTLRRQLGWRGFFGFQMTVGGSLLCSLMSPIYWIMTALWLLIRPTSLELVFPAPVLLVGLVCLFAGNFVFVYLALIACANRRSYDLVKHAVLTPFYWLFISFAAYRAVWHLLVRPHEWEKTQHGICLGGETVSA